MSFDDLPPQPPIHPTADAYAAECLALSRAAVVSTRCILDIPYGPDYWQKIDLFLPSGGPYSDVPVFMFLHGGGWVWGYKEWCGFMAPAFVSLPAIFISASYRLLPEVGYPAPVEDVIAAVKWIWDHIAEHGGSPHRIVIGGHSVGGHIAALLPLQAGWLARAGLPREAVKACICLSTTFNRRMVPPNRAPDHVPSELITEISPQSPLALVRNGRTPFYIAWGGNEAEWIGRTGREMVAGLRGVGCPVEHGVFEDCDHFSIHLKTRHVDDPWTKTVRRYLSQLPANSPEQSR